MSDFTQKRNKLLFEALMNPKFHKDKNNFVLLEDKAEYEQAKKAYDAKLEKAEDLVMQANYGIELSPEEKKFLLDFSKEASPVKPFEMLCSDGQPPRDYIKTDGKIRKGCPSKSLEETGFTIEDFVNTTLDVLGIFDPSGAADLASMTIYVKRGKYVDAFFSFMGAALPYIGDLGKISKMFLKSPFELLNQIYKLVNKVPGVTKLLSWCRKQPVLKPLVDLIENFMSKGPKVISNLIAKEGITQLGGQIISKKIIERKMAFSLRGQKYLWKASPKLKTFEALMAGLQIYGNISSIFEEKVKIELINLRRLEAQLKFEYPETTMMIQYPNGKYSITPRDTVIRAHLILYLVNSTKHYDDKQGKLIGALMHRMQISLQETKEYIEAAKQLKYIDDYLANEIIKTVSDLSTLTVSQIALAPLGKVIKFIIPKWAEEADDKRIEALANTSAKIRDIAGKAKEFKEKAKPTAGMQQFNLNR